ncbi:hypothetical protein [Aureimonas psammosilenae]|uniref:hypothetical protein n=1 Tax=Aureimonas psammosilenae TaxID=2495496 RepID=UPI001260740D|nr:hypothetical protein [Aureimonas psammosilenae]
MPRFSGTLVEDAPASEPVRRPRFSGRLVEDMPQDGGGSSNGYKMARGAYLGALDGASLSFGDELGAGLGAASEYVNSLLPESDVLGTGKPGRSYAEIRDQIRSQNRQAQEEAPGSYLAGQLAGGIASSAPIAGAGLVGGAARSTAARLAIASGTGAGAGAVQGFGAGEGGLNERFKEAGKGMVIGGGLGFLSVPAGAAVGRGLNYAGDFLASRGGPVGRSGQDLLQRTLADEGFTLEDAARRAREMGPSAMLADASEGLRYRAEQIAQSDNPARSGVIGALKDRSAAAGGRINSAYDNALGPRPNVHQTLTTMAKEAKGRADPLYARARAENLPVDVNPVIQAIDGQLMTPADRIAGPSGLPADEVDKALSWVRSHLTDGQSQRTGIDHLDRLERRVRAQTKSAFEGGRSDVGHALNEVGKVLRGQMRASSPIYAQARQTFADDMSVKEAFETGQKLFGRKVHPDFLAAEVADMSDAERQALQLGTRSAVDDAMGQVRNGSLKGRQLLDSDFNERKILTVLGEDDGRALINSLQGEQAMAETAHQAIGNSATSRRMDNPFRVQQRTAQDRAVPGILRSAGNLNFGDAAFRGLEYAQDALGRRTASTMAGELGPALTATGDARERIVQELLARGARREEARAVDPKIRAVTEALIRGGALAYGQNALR